GKIFDTKLVAASSPAQATTTGANLAAGTYSYEVTALVGNAEIPGAVATASVSTGNSVSVNWSAYAGATSYNVYGRSGSLRLLQNVTSGTSYVDTGPTTLMDNPLTLPSSGAVTINVASTSNFNSPPNSIAFGAS